MTLSDKNKECCELLGICWHNGTENYSCSYCGKSELRQDFTTRSGRVQLLAENRVNSTATMLQRKEKYENYKISDYFEKRKYLA
jgi:hypothetical protein